MARAVAVLSTVLCGADLVPQLRGSLGELESCVSKPNFQRAQSSWCGQQQEPVACFKELDDLNPIWDCHLQSAQCSLGAKPCAWPKDALELAQAPERKVSEAAAGNPTRFVTWNLYVFTLAGRIHPVVDELMRMQPEIAAIPEMWHEKHAILDRLNQVSGNVYAFATGGQTEQFNDADILFRADKWEHIASDLVPFSAGRAVNWAALRRKSDGYTLLAAGTHPLCCQGDYVVMEAVDFVIRTLAGVQQQHPYPIVHSSVTHAGATAALLPLSGLGIASGLVSGLLGVGGGTVLVPVLALAFAFPQSEAQGSALLAMLLPSVVSCSTHWSKGNVDRDLAGFAVLGALLGGFGGGEMAALLPERALRLIFAAVLSVVAVKYIRS